MILEITQATRIKDFQKKFRQAYPYLKIEFFGRPHGFSETADNACRCDPEFCFGSITREGEIEVLELRSWDKVGRVEQKFRECFGLYAQVYRRQAYEWTETAGTDELSLDEQNKIGKQSLMQRSRSLWQEREVLL